MHKQSTGFLHSTLSLTRTWSCGSLTTRLFSFPLLPVSPRSERDPDVSLWSGHWVCVWISCQASLYEHQVGEECTSLFHLVFARPGMTSRAPGGRKEATVLSLRSWMPPTWTSKAGIHSEHGETIYLYQHHSRGSKYLPLESLVRNVPMLFQGSWMCSM